MTKHTWWTKTWSFGKSDVIVLKCLLCFAVAAALTPVVVKIIEWIQHKPLHWASLHGLEWTDYTGTLHGATGRVEPRLHLTIENPTTAQRLAELAPSAWLAVAVVIASILLWRMLRALERQQPFANTAVGAMRGLALVALLYAGTGWAVHVFADMTVTFPTTLSWSAIFRISPEPLLLFIGAASLTLFAEVFARGKDMSDELAEVV